MFVDMSSKNRQTLTKESSIINCEVIIVNTEKTVLRHLSQVRRESVADSSALAAQSASPRKRGRSVELAHEDPVRLLPAGLQIRRRLRGDRGQARGLPLARLRRRA